MSPFRVSAKMKNQRFVAVVKTFISDFLFWFLVAKVSILFQAFLQWEDKIPCLNDYQLLVNYTDFQGKHFTINDSFPVSCVMFINKSKSKSLIIL
jgi:hypothetical protein